MSASVPRESLKRLLAVPDYHVHTKLCGHATGEMEDYVREADRKGLTEIGFADHMPLLHTQDPSLTMSIEELPYYVEEVMHLKEKWKKPAVKLGLEVDYIPGQEQAVQKLLSQYDFDYLYGSVHYLGDWLVDHPAQVKEFEKRDLRAVYEEYFKLVAEAARSGLFDAIGHLDVVKKFGYWPPNWTSLAEPAVKAIRDSGICIEVSTAGLRKPVGEIYPSRPVLEACFQAGVPIVLGSDAHAPSEVGYEFDRSIELVHSVGYRHVVSFSKRVRTPAGLTG